MFPKRTRQSAAAPRGWRWAALLALVGLAAFLRLHALDQLPPGLYHDEAFYALDAQHVLRDGRWALFFTGNYGREPLHVYLLAGALGLLGDRVWALRLVSAFSGLLAVPLMYQLGRALLARPGRPAAWAGVLAAGLLATSYWHVNFSRLVFRAADLVTLAVLAAWLLLAAARRRSPRLAALSGVALGLSLYTYTAARLLPVLFLAFAAAQFLSHWRSLGWRPALAQPLVRASLTALAVAALVFAPLGVYFLASPFDFNQRSGDVSILGPDNGPPDQPDPTLGENVAATVRMFIDRGDAHVRHNLPGRPAADALGLLGFWTGLAVALLTWRRAGSQLLLLWLGLLVLPTTLSVDAPHYLRAIGALPAVCLLAAEGLLGWAALAARLRPVLAPHVWPALALAATLLSGTLTGRDYFTRLPLEPTLAGEFHTSVARLAQRALALSAEYDVVIPQLVYLQPTALFFLEPVFGPIQPMHSQPPSDRPAVLLSLERVGLGGLIVLRRVPGQPPVALATSPVSGAASDTLLSLPAHTGAGASPYFAERPGVEGYLPPMLQPSQRLEATFAGLFALRGYDLRREPDVARTGERLLFDLYWQALSWPPRDYVMGLQLQSPLADNLAQHDGMPGQGHYNTTLWRPGNVFVDPHTLAVPAELAPGAYALVLSVYEPGSLRRLPVSSTAPVNGDALRLGTFSVPDPALDPNALPNPVDVTGGDPPVLRLAGYASGPAQPGAEFELALIWQALAPISVDYTVFVHVQDAQGTLVAQRDSPPLDGGAPTSWWAPGDLFRDVHRVGLPAGLPAGSYSVAVGAYYWATGERLPLFAAGARLPDDRWLLPAPLVVEGTTP